MARRQFCLLLWRFLALSWLSIRDSERLMGLQGHPPVICMVQLRKEGPVVWKGSPRSLRPLLTETG